MRRRGLRIPGAAREFRGGGAPRLDLRRPERARLGPDRRHRVRRCDRRHGPPLPCPARRGNRRRLSVPRRNRPHRVARWAARAGCGIHRGGYLRRALARDHRGDRSRRGPLRLLLLHGLRATRSEGAPGAGQSRRRADTGRPHDSVAGRLANCRGQTGQWGRSRQLRDLREALPPGARESAAFRPDHRYPQGRAQHVPAVLDGARSTRSLAVHVPGDLRLCGRGARRTPLPGGWGRGFRGAGAGHARRARGAPRAQAFLSPRGSANTSGS